VLAKNVIVSDILCTVMSKRKPPHGYRPSRSGSTPGRSRGASGQKAGHGGRTSHGEATAAGEIWLYGVHPVLAALANPARRCHRLLLSVDAGRRHGEELAAALAKRGSPAIEPETALPHALDQALPAGAVHQGLALLTAPLADVALADLIAKAPDGGAVRRLIVVLDQVTDPQNVGAILRSAAAFGAEAVLAPGHHAAPETGALAKAASGALEHVPYVQVGNLARCLEDLKAAGFWCLGLTGDAHQTLAKADPGGPLALVLGAEGSGLRRLTRESCDVLARLPTREPISALNVSTAAAVALYQLLAV
jgi:23S rRNA (guanosine2251-2'-O)-methyltransferase